MSAIFSDDRRYRYILWREWMGNELFLGNRYVMFICLNPSTADEMKDDPTVRRCKTFAQIWGFNSLCIGNLFAFRATDPKLLRVCDNPVGTLNDYWLKHYAEKADLIIAAWGARGSYLARDKTVSSLLGQMKCLGTTKNGHPRHPLYVHGGAPLFRYSSEECTQPEPT